MIFKIGWRIAYPMLVVFRIVTAIERPESIVYRTVYVSGVLVDNIRA